MTNYQSTYPNFNKNNKRMFIAFYASLVMSIGITFAVYGASTAGYASKLMGVKVFFTIMYLSSTIIIIMMSLYFLVNRRKSFENCSVEMKENFMFPFSLKGESVNMYLQVGVGMFGISSLLYTTIGTYIHYLDSDAVESTLIHGISESVFIAIQSVFILCSHRLVIFHHQILMKFAMLHLAITNMLMWSNASIGKVSAEFESSSPCIQYENNVVCKLCVYLLPTVSEYSIISSAVINEIYSRIGNVALIEMEHKSHTKHSKDDQDINISRNDSSIEMEHMKFHARPSEDNSEINMSRNLSSAKLEPIESHPKHPKCNPGLIIPGLILMICIFTSIASVVLNAIYLWSDWMFYFHNIQMILINILGIIIFIAAFIPIRRMKFSLSFSTSSLDKNILLISYVISINFSLIVLINCGNYLIMGNAPQFTIDLNLRLTSAVFEIIQSSLQTYFIIDWFHRCHESEESKKPGKNLVAILIGINLGFWFLWTLQIKNGDIIFYKSDKDYSFIPKSDASSFQDLLLFYVQSTLPLGMLFRYHSSACLSEIYAKMYHEESEIILHHIRSETKAKVKDDVPTKGRRAHSEAEIQTLLWSEDDEEDKETSLKNRKKAQDEFRIEQLRRPVPNKNLYKIINGICAQLTVKKTCL